MSSASCTRPRPKNQDQARLAAVAFKICLQYAQALFVEAAGVYGKDIEGAVHGIQSVGDDLIFFGEAGAEAAVIVFEYGAQGQQALVEAQ